MNIATVPSTSIKRTNRKYRALRDMKFSFRDWSPGGLEISTPRVTPQVTCRGSGGAPRIAAEEHRQDDEDQHQQGETDVQSVTGHVLLLGAREPGRARLTNVDRAVSINRGPTDRCLGTW
jgi:hypothetical protein